MTLMTLHPLAAANPVSHIIDHSLFGDYTISNVTVMLTVSAILTMLIVIPAARRIATGPGRSVDDMRAKGLLANFVEAVCLYLRNDVFKPILKEHTDKYIGILWTFFWFILICNVMGLIPLIDLTGGLFGWNHGHGIGGTATQSIWVTGALALMAFILINGVALAKDPIGYFKHLGGGAPWYMWPIVVPVEFAGIFIKPTALAIRLFANMTGGHIMLAVLFGFVASLTIDLGGPGGWLLAPVPLLGAVAIYMLEVLVALLQAFIFTFLTGMFLAQLIVHGDHHDEEHGHGDHGHHHHHDHAHDHHHDHDHPGRSHGAAATK